MEKKQVIVVFLIALFGIVFFSSVQGDAAADVINDGIITGYAASVPCNENNNDRECAHLTDRRGRSFVCRQRVPWKRGTRGGFWAERNFAANEAASCRGKLPLQAPCRRDAHCAGSACSQGRCVAAAALPAEQAVRSVRIVPGRLQLADTRLVSRRVQAVPGGLVKETRQYSVPQRSGSSVPVTVEETRSGCFTVQSGRRSRFTVLVIGDQYASTRALQNDIKKLFGIRQQGGLFNTAPFSSNAEKFTVKGMVANVHTREIRSRRTQETRALAESVSLAAARKKARQCGGTIDLVVTLSKENFRSLCFPWLGCLVSTGRGIDADDQKLFVHEFAHGFAGLVDEYVDSRVTAAFSDYGGIINTIFSTNIRNVIDLFSFLGVARPPNCATSRAEAERLWLNGNYPRESIRISQGCGFSSTYFRSTRTSIMRDHTQASFGAVSENYLINVLEGRQQVMRRNSLLYRVPGLLDEFVLIADIAYSIEDAYDWAGDTLNDAGDLLDDAWSETVSGTESLGRTIAGLAEDAWREMEEAARIAGRTAESAGRAIGRTAEDVGQTIGSAAEDTWDEVSSWF